MSNTSDIRVLGYEPLLAPATLLAELPLGAREAKHVEQSRADVRAVLTGIDDRLLVVAGPCSVHDPAAALDYAERLAALAGSLHDDLLVVMRVYFEKPRTTTGWKGLINDPHLDDSFNVEEGLQLARKVLLDINELGLPAGTEALDPISPQYMSDLIAWSAIGARTTESQTHREMASGLSTPVGFKNGTDGGLQVAINALLSVSKPHRFLGINQNGQVAVIRTKGNGYGHIVLRGGSKGPNYDSVTIALVEKELARNSLAPNIMVDCSHANSNKDPSLQPLVMNDVVHQIMEGNRSIVGAMLESNLHAGNQPIPADLSRLKYGVSVTDACIDWTATEKLLREARHKLKDVLPARLPRTAEVRSIGG